MHLISTRTLWVKHYFYHHFTNKETESEEGKEVVQGYMARKWMREPGFKSRPCASRARRHNCHAMPALVNYYEQVPAPGQLRCVGKTKVHTHSLQNHGDTWTLKKFFPFGLHSYWTEDKNKTKHKTQKPTKRQKNPNSAMSLKAQKHWDLPWGFDCKWADSAPKSILEEFQCEDL